MKKDLTQYLKNKAKELKSDWNDVPAWVIDASVEFFKQTKKTKTIEEALGEYLCEDDEHFPEIIKALKDALTNNPDQLVDFIPFKKGKQKSTITMWEPVESTFTVKNFCELVGIK